MYICVLALVSKNRATVMPRIKDMDIMLATMRRPPVCMHVCLYVCTCTNSCVCVCVCVHDCDAKDRRQIQGQIHVYVCVCVYDCDAKDRGHGHDACDRFVCRTYIHTHTHTYADINLCMYICTYM
jgi:hypothetical protein